MVVFLNNRKELTMQYVLITYKGEIIDKDASFIFESDVKDIETNPYKLAPFAVGSNQTIVKLEDCPFPISNG